MTEPIHDVIERWHAHLRGELAGGLEELLDDDVVFYSPIVFTPQRGKDLTTMYLLAAGQTLPGSNDSADATAGEQARGDHRGTDAADGGEDAWDGRFRYAKQVLGGDTAVLEFETTVEGKYVNGVDIIRCNDEGRIVEFKVMIRPLQAVNLVHAQMKAMLESMQSGG